MQQIRQRLDDIAHTLGLSGTLLARAQRRYPARRRAAWKYHNKAVRLEQRADELRREGHPVHADAAGNQAQRYHAKAFNQHVKAQIQIGRIKKLTQRIHDLGETQTELEAELRRLANRVVVNGNTVRGGSPEQRLKVCALASAAACAAGRRPNFYSQPGAWDVDHCITGESYGERSDCSSWFTSVYRSCGLPDPNGADFTGGWTGSLVAAGKQVSRPQPGCGVVYGPGAGHHIELFVGPGVKTIGHGSSPVDPGVIDLFGDGDYRFFVFPRK